MIPSKIKNHGFIGFLTLLIITIGYLSYKNAQDYNALKAVFEQDKKELEQELALAIKDYKQASNKSNHFSLQLKNELAKVVQLRDSIKNLKEDNFSLISYYRKKTATLIKENKLLLEKITQLDSTNNALAAKNENINKALRIKETQNSKLSNINTVLNKKITEIELIETSKIKFEALKKRRRGKLTSTSRASKTTAFKVEFDLLENKITPSGSKKIYIQIVDNNKNIIEPIKQITLNNKKNIWCSEILDVEYNNTTLSVVSLVYLKHIITAGEYQVNTYVDGVFSRKNSLVLK